MNKRDYEELTDEQLDNMIEYYEYVPELTKSEYEEYSNLKSELLERERNSFMYDYWRDRQTDEEKIEFERKRDEKIAEREKQWEEHLEYMKHREEYEKKASEEYPGMSREEIFTARFEAHKIDK